MASVWINEFHYDNTGTDTGEFVEIAGVAGTDLTGWSIVLYNGANGAVYDTDALSGTIPTQSNGFGTVSIAYPSNGLQNGAPDGIALVDNTGTVIEFLSYEGTFTAVDGPANGLTSVDVGVSEPGNANGTSVGRVGTGDDSGDFRFALITDDTPGGVNVGQTFTGAVAVPLVSIAAQDAAAAETGADAGTFRISRSGATTEALVVSFAVAGTAASGDFTPALTGTATIAAGQSFVDVTITPVDDASVEGAETVTLTLTDAAAYDLGASISASVTIADNDVAPPAAIVINELDSDTPGPDAAEFVELYDGGVGNVSLDGLVAVFFNGNGDTSYAAFDLDGFRTDANGFFVLGNAGVSGVDLVFDGNLLQNGADAVAIYRGNASDFPTGTAVTSANLVDAIVYDTNDADDSGLLSGLGETVQVNEGGNDTLALARVPDGTGDFVVQAPTPGAANIVTPPPPVVTLTAIFTIQGAGHRSALTGQAVTTEGIVTAVDTNGFYLQDAIGDGNVNTSDGIFVFTGSAPGVVVGQGLRVAGTVSEFIPGGAATGNLSVTQISGAPTITVLSSGNALPTATEIGGLTGRQVPTQFIISPDEASTPGQINLNNAGTVNNFDPAQDSIDFFESLEGMRVSVAQVQAVSGTNSFGEIFGVAAQATPTEFNANGGVTLTGTDILTADFNPERLQIQLDTGVLPGGSLPNVNVGDTITGVTGVVGYNFGEFEINITAPIAVTPGDAAPEVTNLVGDRDTLVVAGYNVLNLDPNDNEAAGNQPDRDVAQGRFDLIAQQITVNLKLPDILALQEVQDNNGGDFGGVTAADVTLQRLVDAIFAASGVRYSFVDNPFIAAETNGGQPGGNIRTAFLYNDARVDFNGVSAVTDPVAQQTDPTNPFFDSRPPLAGNFSFNGQDITVVSVHNSSRGGSTPLSGAVQQPTLGSSEAARNAQSQAINDFVDARLASNPDSHIVTIGDFNGFSFERWSNLLEGDADGGPQVMTNLTNLATDPQDQYSFIFNGNSQALDHTFVTQNLVDDVTLDRVHVNVDFAAAGGIRASDHDPEVVAIDLGVLVTLAGGINRRNDRLVGTGENELIDGLGGRDTYTGGRGNDIFVLGAGRDFDIVTDFGNGADQLDVTAWGIDGFEDLSFVQRSNNVILVQDGFGHRGIISAFDGSINARDFTADQFIFVDLA